LLAHGLPAGDGCVDRDYGILRSRWRPDFSEDTVGIEVANNAIGCSINCKRIELSTGKSTTSHNGEIASRCSSVL